jgi:hypothetical protein
MKRTVGASVLLAGAALGVGIFLGTRTDDQSVAQTGPAGIIIPHMVEALVQYDGPYDRVNLGAIDQTRRVAGSTKGVDLRIAFQFDNGDTLVLSVEQTETFLDKVGRMGP